MKDSGLQRVNSHATYIHDGLFCFSRAILKNPDLQSSSDLSQLFYNDFWGTPLTHSGSHKSYRPLCVLTFRINHALGALNPFGYHLGNVLLHALVSALFTYIVKDITKRPLTAYISGLLFASHPVHTEAVAGIYYYYSIIRVTHYSVL